MATRKKPGRPRKKIDVCPIGVHGIVPTPVNPDDCVDLVYNQPQLLKCIISIFKEYDSDEIIIEFYSDRVVFTGKDHSLRVSIHIVINAADMNLYYFSPNHISLATDGATSSSANAFDKTPITLTKPAADDGNDDSDGDGDGDGDGDDGADATSAGAGAGALASIAGGALPAANSQGMYRIVVKRDNLEIVAAIIEKTHYKLTMSLHRDDLSSLYIMLSSCEYDSEDCFEISIVPRAGAIDVIDIPNLSLYPLEFTLDSHHLRRKIGELKKVSPDMIIKKIGTADLEISFGAATRVTYTGTYKTAAKIKLRSNVPEGEVFVATMSIGRIRPLMTANIPGGTTFFANKVDPLVIQVGLDQRADNHYAIIARLLINTTH